MTTGLLDRFVETLAGQSSSNRKNYRRRLSDLLNQPVEQITVHHVNAWLERQRARGLSPVTLAGYKQAAKAFFSWCVREGFVESNPASHLKTGSYYADRPKMPDESAVAFVTAVARNWIRQRDPLRVRRGALWLLALETGARLGELLSLRAADAPAAVAHGRIAARGKTGSVSLTFARDGSDALAAYVALRPSSPFAALWLSSKRVRGKIRPLSLSAAQDDFRAICTAAGVKTIYCHTLRHRAGDLVTRQFGAVVAQRKLNHKDISTTLNFYHHPNDDDIASATAALAPQDAGDELARLLFGDVGKRGAGGA